MIQNRDFKDRALRNPKFVAQILAIIIDEVHCVSLWGSDFRKLYGTLGYLRALLLKRTPFIGVSATITPRVKRDLVSRLQMNPSDFLWINKGNDRRNVSLLARPISSAQNSYADLNFLIPRRCPGGSGDIPKAFVYLDDTLAGAQIVDHLNGLVPSTFRKLGVVRPYNASLSLEIRTALLQLFRSGVVRILVCTDAAGMVSV
jgi:superfamily II DNA helicase RecQ